MKYPNRQPFEELITARRIEEEYVEPRGIVDIWS